MIVQLSIDNFLRLKAVQINPDGSLVQVTGRNDQGKSSVLKAIQAALGGKANEPPDPVRHGADSAKVVLVIDDKYRVEKVWEDGESKLRLTSADGKKRYSSPQTLLNELYADIAFDPMAFARMKPADQAEQLRKMVGLDLTEIDGRSVALYEQRRDLGRDLRRLEGALDEIEEVEAPDGPPEDLEAFRARHDGALRRHEALGTMMRDHENVVVAQGAAKDRIARLERELTEANAELARQVERNGSLAEAIRNYSVGETPANVMEEMNAASARNRLREQAADRGNLKNEVAALRKQTDGLTANLDELAADRQLTIESAEMPIEGLGFGDDGITYNGVPFEQAAQSQQIRVSTAIGLARNPGGIICIRDGSLMDLETMSILAEMVGPGQVWIEKVTEGEEVGIVIEDGAVRAAREGAETATS